MPIFIADETKEWIDELVGSLAECRDIPGFDMSLREGDWAGAMSDPLCVPHYVRVNVQEIMMERDALRTELAYALQRIEQLEYQYEC